ncbi:PAS domain-containing protein [Janthinobacterium agaricidamnosum]|uniref:PAS domain-containing protein n=1 Tax=Janthinobacterium agaricidamnosum TaxID=55508 RepID=UPI001F09E3E6|nr:PAS domain-containing protein [Janthinobacterium agaricidamnosum]
MRLSLLTRWTALIVTLLVLGIVIALLLAHFLPGQPLLVLAGTLLCVLPVAVITIRAQLQAMLSLFRALSGTVASYQDGDFGFSLRWPQNDELADLVAAHNALGDVLRKQRLDLVQRELLLDTMVQNTPVAMLLVAEGSAIVYANLAARQLLHHGRRLEGIIWPTSCSRRRRPWPKRWRAATTACLPAAKGSRKRCITWRGAASA